MTRFVKIRPSEEIAYDNLAELGLVSGMSSEVFRRAIAALGDGPKPVSNYDRGLKLRHYKEGEERTYLRLMNNPEELGWSLMYNRWPPGGPQPRVFSGWASLGNRSRLDEWEWDTHENLVNVGTFVPFEPAKATFDAYLADPTRRPETVMWITGDEMPPPPREMLDDI